MPDIPAGEWIAGGAVALAFAKNVVDWISSWGKGRSKQETQNIMDQRDIARHDATLAQLSEAQRLAAERFNTHDRECAAFRGSMTTKIESIEKTGERTERAISQLQSQIRMVAVGSNDKSFEFSQHLDSGES